MRICVCSARWRVTTVKTVGIALLPRRLKEVVYSERQLYLVFEWIDKDLKKYMDAVPTGLEPGLIKASQTVVHSCWQAAAVSFALRAHAV